jgi:hypothetical protein
MATYGWCWCCCCCCACLFVACVCLFVACVCLFVGFVYLPLTNIKFGDCVRGATHEPADCDSAFTKLASLIEASSSFNAFMAFSNSSYSSAMRV